MINRSSVVPSAELANLSDPGDSCVGRTVSFVVAGSVGYALDKGYVHFSLFLQQYINYFGR